jgi:serine/threonine protein kinase
MPKKTEFSSQVAGEVVPASESLPMEHAFKREGLRESPEIGVLIPSESVEQFPKFFEQLELTEEVKNPIPEQATKQEWEIAKKRARSITHAKKISRKDNDTILDHSFLVVPQAQGADPKLFALAPQGKFLSTDGFQSVIKSAYDESDNYYIVKIKPIIIKKAELDLYLNSGKSSDSESKIRKKLGQQFYEILRTSESRKMGGSKLSVNDDEIVIKEYLIEDYLGQSLFEAQNEILALSFFDRFELALQLLDKLEKLHDNKIIHCDLHSGNVLLKKMPSGKYELSIIDFGLSRIEGEDSLKVELGKNKINIFTLDPEQTARGLLYRKHMDLLRAKTGSNADPKELEQLEQTILNLPRSIVLSKSTDIYAAYSIMRDELNLPFNLTQNDDFAFIKEKGITGIREMLHKKKQIFASTPNERPPEIKNIKGGYIDEIEPLQEQLLQPTVKNQSVKKRTTHKF